MTGRVRLRTGSGPLGTGVFLLGRRVVDAEVWEARRWVSLLFVPLVPLSAARFRGPADAPTGESWEVEGAPLDAPLRGDVGRTWSRAAGLLLLALGPAAFAWWTIPQTGLVQALKVVLGVSAPVLVLMGCDLRTPRVSR